MRSGARPFAECLAAARCGDRSAIGQLAEMALPQLQRVARDLLGPLRARYATSDIVQSSLVEALSAFPDFRGHDRAEFVQWLVRMLENNVRDRRRFVTRSKRTLARETTSGVLALLPTNDKTPFSRAVDRDELVRVAGAIAGLPKEQQRVLHYTVLRGLSHGEAAVLMDKSEEACRALLARARAGLAVRLTRGAGS